LRVITFSTNFIAGFRQEEEMTKSDSVEDKNRPEMRWQIGSISISVFQNEVRKPNGETFPVRKVVLQKTYRDESGNYRNTNSLDVQEIPKAILALEKAYEHCVMAPRRSDEEE
jgi:hypothetical protein